jgi:hypothetical protein
LTTGTLNEYSFGPQMFQLTNASNEQQFLDYLLSSSPPDLIIEMIDVVWEDDDRILPASIDLALKRTMRHIMKNSSE